MIPNDLVSRWSKLSKLGKRALVSYAAGGGNEAAAKEKLEETVSLLLSVADEMAEWRDRGRGVAAASAALIECFCDEASLRHQMLLDLTPETASVALVAWRLEPFLNSPAAEQVRFFFCKKKKKKSSLQKGSAGNIFAS